jgi:hypothetical protein
VHHHMVPAFHDICGSCTDLGSSAPAVRHSDCTCRAAASRASGSSRLYSGNVDSSLLMHVSWSCVRVWGVQDRASCKTVAKRCA